MIQMINESYTAKCTLHKDADGVYQIGCAIDTTDDRIEADYTGEDLVEGLNSIMDSVEEQFAKIEENKKEAEQDESCNAYIRYLEDYVSELEAENEKLQELSTSYIYKNLMNDYANGNKSLENLINKYSKYFR